MKSRLGAGFFCRHLRVACLQANQGRPYEKCTPGPAFQSRLRVSHRKNRTGGNAPNHARAKATLSSTVWFELGVTFPRICLRVALWRLVLCVRGQVHAFFCLVEKNGLIDPGAKSFKSNSHAPASSLIGHILRFGRFSGAERAQRRRARARNRAKRVGGGMSANSHSIKFKKRIVPLKGDSGGASKRGRGFPLSCCGGATKSAICPGVMRRV